MKFTHSYNYRRPALAFAAVLVAAAACGGDDEGTTGTGGSGTGTGSGTATGTGSGTGTGTGSGTATGTGSGTGSGTGTGSGGAAPCETYCADNIANCDGDNDQWAGDQALCEATCSFFAPGMEDDTTGDTLACRQTHTADAANNPADECAAAGPYGGDVCDDAATPTQGQCDVFCGLIQAICTGGNQQYPNEGECMTDCLDPINGFGGDSMDDYSADTGAMGNTFACRGYHLTAAAGLDAGVHCPHAGGAEAPCVSVP